MPLFSSDEFAPKLPVRNVPSLVGPPVSATIEPGQTTGTSFAYDLTGSQDRNQRGTQVEDPSQPVVGPWLEIMIFPASLDPDDPDAGSVDLLVRQGINGVAPLGELSTRITHAYICPPNVPTTIPRLVVSGSAVEVLVTNPAAAAIDMLVWLAVYARSA